MSDATILLKADTPNVKFEWSLALLDQYADALGCGPQESALRNFLRVTLQYAPPSPWEAKVDHKARIFYVNTETNEPIWEHPLQPTFIELVKAFRELSTVSDRRAKAGEAIQAAQQEAALAREHPLQPTFIELV